MSFTGAHWRYRVAVKGEENIDLHSVKDPEVLYTASTYLGYEIRLMLLMTKLNPIL